jgi:hypothetical protein
LVEQITPLKDVIKELDTLKGDEKTRSNGICAVIISNNGEKSEYLCSVLAKCVDSIVIVTDNKDKVGWAVNLMPKIRTVQSKSSNFAYLRNLGIWVCDDSYIFRIDDDEVMSQTFIKNFRVLTPGIQAFSVLVRSTFMGKIVNMWDRVTPRIIERSSAHYVGQVHEHLSSRFLVTKTIPGSITNKSYDDWGEYWKKAFRYASLENKVLRIMLFRTLFPLYNFFSKSGYKDGLTGIKIVMASVFYGFLMSCRGRSILMHFPSIEEAEAIIMKQIENIDDKVERDYIKSTLSSIKRGDIPQGSSINEELSQILSALVYA